MLSATLFPLPERAFMGIILLPLFGDNKITGDSALFSMFLLRRQKEGQSQCQECSFDLMTFRDHNTVVFEDDSGNKKELKCNERYYVPSEIAWLLKTLGFRTIDIFGAKLGAYSRNDRLTTEHFEMLIIADKK